MANRAWFMEIAIASVPALIAYLASRRHTHIQIRTQQLTSEANSLREMIEATERKALRYFTGSHEATELESLGIEIVADVGNIARRIASYKQSDGIKKAYATNLTGELIKFRQALTNDTHASGSPLPLKRADPLITKIRVTTDQLAKTVAACC